MKDKNVAGVLALIFGSFGVHRFYLGQPVLGILYLVFFWTSIPAFLGLLDAILFFVMDKKVFDMKYNTHYVLSEQQGGRFENERYKRADQRRTASTERRQPVARTPAPAAPQQAGNPYKTSGIKKFKDFDFEGAIADFKKSLGMDYKDVAVHFNIACAYSMEEQANEAFFHLSKAVEYGFVDFERIHHHDSLAFLRTRDEFERFVKSGYRLIPIERLEQEEKLESLKNAAPPIEPILDLSQKEAPKETPTEEQIPDDLLEQFRKLEEFRQKGFLTDAEFTAQKRKLLD
jgi:TM2 domain-containing membrane protein YozV